MNLRHFKRKLQEHQTIASILVGLIVTVLAWLLIEKYEEPAWVYVLVPIISYGLAACLASLIPLLSDWLLSAHRGLGSRTFRKATDNRQFSLWPVMSTYGMLNFTFFTLVFWVPYSILCRIFQVEAVEPFVPRSYQELIQTITQFKVPNLDVLFVFVLSVSFGPAFVSIVSRLREDRKDRGQKLFEFFQVLFYVSIFIPAVASLSWHKNDFAAYFTVYRNVLLLILLPGSIAGAGIKSKIESEMRTLRSKSPLQ